MLAASEGPRTSSVTCRAYLARCSAAWPGGVAAADDAHLLARHRRRLGHGGAVEHAAADQALERGDPEPAVVDAGGDDDARGRGPRCRRTSTPCAGRRRRRAPAPARMKEYSRAEGPGLLERPEGEVGAADAAGEARVVADQRAGAGLAADRLLLDHQRGQPLGGGVDRRREAGRARAHHDDVVDPVRRSSGAISPKASAISRSVGLTSVVGGEVNASTTTGSSGSSSPSPASIRSARVGPDLVEADRDVVAAEGVAQRVGPLVALLADQPHRLEADALGEVPVVERVGDRAVELLVARSLGSQHQQLGVPVGDRPRTPRTCSRSRPRSRRPPAWPTGAARRPGAGSRGRRGRRGRSSR